MNPTKMSIRLRLKEHYKYLRNLKKLRSRASKNDLIANFNKQLSFYSQFISPNDLCFDIGANIGDKTDLFLHLGAKVVAVEPQESCWRVLNRRFKKKDVHVEPLLLASQEGVKRLFIDKSSTLSSMSEDWIEAVKQSGRFKNHKWGHSILVQATTLDTLIEKYGRPVFCKIDVEGVEWEVLKGLSQPLKLISFEFVSERIQAALNCVDYLCKLGRTQFNFYLGDAMSFSMLNWVHSYKIKNLLMAMDKAVENYGEVYVRFTDRT